MTITKVKYNPEAGITIVYERLGADGLDTITVESNDAPQPSFVDAFEALQSFARGALSLTAKTDVTVRGLTFKDAPRGDEKVDGVMLTALVQSPGFNTTWTTNTPLSPIAGFPGGDAATQAIKLVRAEAKAYVNGKRKQLGMFSDASGDVSGDGASGAAPVIDDDEFDDDGAGLARVVELANS